MKTVFRKGDKVLLIAFVISMVAYILIFAFAFAELPLNIPPWHQFLLLCFHFIPMFFLQLLLCRYATLCWKLLIPLILLVVPGILFLSKAEWDIIGWFIFLFWCVAPILGSAFAWIVSAIQKRIYSMREN